MKVARAESRRQSSEVLIVYGEEGQVEEAHQETEEPLRRTVQVNCSGLVVAKEKGANPNLNNTRGPIDWLTSSNCDGLQIDIGGVSHLGEGIPKLLIDPLAQADQVAHHLLQLLNTHEQALSYKQINWWQC